MGQLDVAFMGVMKMGCRFMRRQEMNNVSEINRGLGCSDEGL